MSKESLFPHKPAKKEPLFPHQPKSRQATSGTGPIQEGALVRLKSGTEGWVKAQVVEYFDVFPTVGGYIYGGGFAPGYKVHILEGKHKGETIRVPTNYIELISSSKMPQTLGGERIPSQYRNLVDYIGEPLPEYSLLTIEVEEGERKIDVVLRQLKSGVETIQQSENFRQFLTTMSRFHDYSIGNQILIMIQKPDATRVAGFNTWKELGRWVKKGAKGIAILAPVMPPRAICPNCGARIPRGASYCPKCGTPVEEVEAEVSPAYFRAVSVFDISQTEGKPLPEFEVPVLTGEVNEDLFSRALALARLQGLEVSFESRPGQDPGIKGEFSGKDIWVRPEESRAQQLKTLLHEMAHYYSEGVFRIPKRDAETIAESSAYVVGAHYGFDTGVRSFPYVALWSQDEKVLKENLAAIRKVASTILQGLEKP